MTGKNEENVWKPAFAEIEEALVPAFIIEELADGRFTVFVPSVPTPFAGAVDDPHPGTGAPSRRSFHAGASVYIPLGIEFKRAPGDENREYSEIGTEYFRKRKAAARNWGFFHFRSSAFDGVQAQLL